MQTLSTLTIMILTTWFESPSMWYKPLRQARQLEYEYADFVNTHHNDTGATKVADTFSLSLTKRHSTYRGKLREYVCFHEIEKTSTVKALSAEFSFSCSGEVVLLYRKNPTCPHTWHLKKEALFLCLLSCW